MTYAVRHATPAPDATAEDFKGAMRGLAGGVSVITVGQGRDITGMTVTSVTSLSVEPPTLIVSVNRSSSSWSLLRRYGAFGVNILGADQREIAERFTGKGGLKGADRFAGADWVIGTSGTTLLVGALAAIDCEVEEIVERHSHAIVIGRVRQVLNETARPALVYWDGGYAAHQHAQEGVTVPVTSSSLARGLREI
ncbi:MAG: monooxygenase [Tardiphaga sp.]|nr:monooxygenase [Tardiphaga sp.]